jgi:nucleotide-binding universal stress UspA family protein
MATCPGAQTLAGTVVVAVDGREGTPQLLAWAATEAASRQTGLTIVHVCPRPPMWDPVAAVHLAPELVHLRQHALHLLSRAEELAHAIAPQIEVRLALRSGGPARAIREESKRASLTIIGQSRDTTRSVTWQVIARSSCPVSVVGFDDSTRQMAQVDGVVAILLPDQATATTLAVLDLALGTARRRRCRATVVADWSRVLRAGPVGPILRARANISGVPDLRTDSLSPTGQLPPIEPLGAAMVVLASRPRHGDDTETRRAVQRLLLAGGTSTTYVPPPSR